MQMHKVRVTALARQDWKGYFIPGNSVEIVPDQQWPENKSRILGSGMDDDGKPRATFLEGGVPTELLVDDMLLKHLQRDQLVKVELIIDEPPAAKAVVPAGPPPSQRGR